MKYFLPAFRMFVFMTLLTGLIYPLLVTGVSHTFFSHFAKGSFVEKNNSLVGSELIGQKFEADKYFWPRPSAIHYNPLPSGGSNLSLASQDLKKRIDESSIKLQEKNSAEDQVIPQDILFSSGSGLDPHISPSAAYYQIERISKSRNLESTAVRKLVKDLTEHRQFGILGEPRVNVLKLNLALDALGD